MNNTKNSLILIIIFNFALLITFSNFSILEPGVQKANINNLFQEEEEMINLSYNGQLRDFFVESYNASAGDGFQYMKIALGEESFEPYTLRPLYPKLIGKIALYLASIIDKEHTKATALNILQPIMGFFNSIFLVIGVFFLYLTLKKYLDDELLSWLLALGLIVGIGTIRTSQFFMLDVLSYSIGAVALYFFTQSKYFYLSITIAIGILIKEVLIIYSLLLLYPLHYNKKSITLVILTLMIPISLFIGLRLFMSVDILSMQYGWNVSQGEIDLKYFMVHLGNLSYAILFFTQILFTFGLLWIFTLYSLKSQDKKLLLFLFGVIVSIVFANAFLASNVMRVIFIVYPIIALLSAIGIAQLINENFLVVKR